MTSNNLIDPNNLISPKKFLSKYSAAISKALSTNNIEINKMLSIIATEFRLSPLLAHCSEVSVLNCILQASQLGLRPGALLGHFYLIPFNNKKKGIMECQFILGYKGMIELATRGKGAHKIEAFAVYENDYFEFEYGTHAFLKHQPAISNRGSLIATWAKATLKDGTDQFYVCWKEEILEAKSKAKTSNIWESHFEAMATKTAIRRLFKYLPINPDMQIILALDESADLGTQADILAKDNQNYLEITEEENTKIEEPKKSYSDKLNEELEKNK